MPDLSSQFHLHPLKFINPLIFPWRMTEHSNCYIYNMGSYNQLRLDDPINGFCSASHGTEYQFNHFVLICLLQQPVLYVFVVLPVQQSIPSVDLLRVHLRQELISLPIPRVKEYFKCITLHAIVSHQKLDVVYQPTLEFFIRFLRHVLLIKLLQALLKLVWDDVQHLAPDSNRIVVGFYVGS